MNYLMNSLMADHLFTFDPLALIVGTLIFLVTLVTLGYAGRYMAGDHNYQRFLINIILTGASALAMVFSNHIVVLFVFWCLANILLVRLMIHKATWQAARNAGMQALSIFGVGFITLAGGLALLYQASGSFYLSEILRNYQVTSSLVGQIALTLILVTAFAQSAAWPFHRWLLSSLNSPTPVSALMHAGLVNGGGFLLIRLAPLYLDHQNLLTIIFIVGLVSAVIGTFWKLLQTDIKRMLACSTMSQMGFMLMQCGMGFFAAALSHLVWHGLFKAYLFLNVGSVVEEKREKDQFRRIAPSQFLVSCLIGIAGAYGFSLIAGTPMIAADTTVIMTAMAYMAATQLACRVLTEVKSAAAIPLGCVVSFGSGLLYGCNIRLIEMLVGSQSLFVPQPLNLIYMAGLATLGAVWLTMNLNLINPIQSSDVWKSLYVRGLNASQPHPATITAIRTSYKF